MLKMRHCAITHPFGYGPLGQKPALRFGKVGGADEWITNRSLRLATVAFARKLRCLNRAGNMLSITSQWQDPDFFFLLLEYIAKISRSRMLKPLVSEFCPDLSVGLTHHWLGGGVIRPPP